MAIDLAQFHEAFFEEGFEALDSMEAALLRLDVGAPDNEIINTVFRVAHSIKGGSATFGFKDIASFTHTLETLLDELRGQRMQVTVGISDLLLKSVDVMKAMLRATQRKEPADVQTVADLQFDLELAIANKNAAPPPAPAKAAAPPAAATSVPAAAATPPEPASATVAPVAAAPAPGTGKAAELARTGGWRIAFKPLPQLLSHGNDPLRMFAELEELGSLEVTADLSALPAFAELDPEVCTISWVIDLHSEVTREVVEHVFDWAEGECTLEISRLEPEAATASAVTAAPAVVPAPATPVAAAVAPQAQAAVTPAEPTEAPVEAATATAAAAAAAPAAAPTAIAPAAADKGAPAKAAAAHGADAGSIRVSIEKIDELMNTVGELVITQSMLMQLGTKVEGPAAERLRTGLTQLERNMRELQESVMRVRMLPISFVFSRFPRMVRDLSQRLSKQIELKLTGENTELDKTVLEKIGDPLVHLVRNCIDHGIETPDVRVAAGKPAQGTVFLNAFHKGGSITVEVGDDGRGLGRDRILEKARSRGLIGNEPLTDAQIYDLIFLPGFSTVEHATDLSGRGVGMDVVRRNIKELGGTVEIFSETNKGSRFVITLPLTLAIVDGQSVAVGEDTYIVPLVSIMESLQLEANMVSRLPGRGEVFRFRDNWLPVLRLHEVFGVKPRSSELTEGLVMVVEGEGRKVGIFVDDLLDQQQVVVKSMETNYGRIPGVSGATILGEGSVALILDIPGLIRMGTARAVA